MLLALKGLHLQPLCVRELPGRLPLAQLGQPRRLLLALKGLHLQPLRVRKLPSRLPPAQLGQPRRIVAVQASGAVASRAITSGTVAILGAPCRGAAPRRSERLLGWDCCLGRFESLKVLQLHAKPFHHLQLVRLREALLSEQHIGVPQDSLERLDATSLILCQLTPSAQLQAQLHGVVRVVTGLQAERDAILRVERGRLRDQARRDHPALELHQPLGGQGATRAVLPARVLSLERQDSALERLAIGLGLVHPLVRAFERPLRVLGQQLADLNAGRDQIILGAPLGLEDILQVALSALDGRARCRTLALKRPSALPKILIVLALQRLKRPLGRFQRRLRLIQPRTSRIELQVRC